MPGMPRADGGGLPAVGARWFFWEGQREKRIMSSLFIF
jgi:hypothetical protein